MAEIEYRMGRDEDRENIVDFGNYIFSQAHVPHDFKRLLPKAYADHLPHLGAEHFLAVRDGHIRGMVALRPIDLKILNIDLNIGYVGTVSVHPYARGEGHMKALMGNMLRYAREQKMDMLVLGGNRQRYNWFGFENAGWAYQLEITESSIKHAFKDIVAEGITFSPLSENRPEEVDYAWNLSKRQKVSGDRPRERFLDILHSWNSESRLIRKDGRMTGYVAGNIKELVLEDESMILPVLKALWEEKQENIVFSCPPQDTERLSQVFPVAGSVRIEKVEMVNVLNWPKVLKALLLLKAEYHSLQDGSFRMKIGEKPTIAITVDQGEIDVEETDKDPDVCLTHLEAERRLFGMDVFAQGSLYADWFPLPFWMSQADTF